VKRYLIGAVLLLASAVMFAQDPTEIAGHRLGESFQDWLSRSQIEMEKICRPHSRSDKLAASKSDCKLLSSIRDGEAGTFYTTNKDQKIKVGWLFVGGKVAEVSMEQILDFDATGSYVHVSTAQEQIRLLTQAYGPPSKTETDTYQNDYGVKYDAVKAAWNMPDGTLILAAENLTFTDGLGRHWNVRFISKQRAEELAKAQEKNPYLK